MLYKLQMILRRYQEAWGLSDEQTAAILKTTAKATVTKKTKKADEPKDDGDEQTMASLVAECCDEDCADEGGGPFNLFFLGVPWTTIHTFLFCSLFVLARAIKFVSGKDLVRTRLKILWLIVFWKCSFIWK